jgi:hypothetical protein
MLIFVRTQMQKFRTAMKGQRVPGLMEWDREFAHTSTLTNDFASVRTLQNRIVELKSGKSQESSLIHSAGSDLFNERHPQAAKWSFQSHYYEFVSTSASRIQRFWRAVCKRRAFFVSIRYAAAFCILRWMLHKIKGQVGRASGGLHSLHVTANYTHEAAHLAHLIYEKNSLRYQLEGTMLIQNSRAYLANDLRILKAIQEYQSGARLRTARDAIAASDGLRLVANQESAQAEQKLNAMIQVEAIRLMPRPEIPIESVSHPVGPEADRRHVFLLPNKAAARQHKECVTNCNTEFHSKNNPKHSSQISAKTVSMEQPSSEKILMSICKHISNSLSDCIRRPSRAAHGTKIGCHSIRNATKGEEERIQCGILNTTKKTRRMDWNKSIR